MDIFLRAIAAFALGLLVLPSPLTVAAQVHNVLLTVTNPTAEARPAEVVDLPLAEVLRRLHASEGSGVIARLPGNEAPLLTQQYASQVDGRPDRLLVLVDLASRQRITLLLEAAAGVPVQQSLVRARKVPERDDDFAWENNVVAYRVYGPALQAKGEIASGIDVWSKRVPDFVTETWYQRDQESARTHNRALSYHRDNGQGLDSYEVGPSRGCGGTAVFVNGTLIASRNVAASRILANGPIRTDFLLHYSAWKADGTEVEETKRITLDAGSRLNHMRSTFRFHDPSAGGKQILTVAAGLAMHHGAVLDRPLPAILSVWDTPQLATAGRIGTSIVLSVGATPRFGSVPMAGNTTGDALFLFTIHSGDTIDYYAGAGWSQADTPTQQDFNRYLERFHNRLRYPVAYHWRRGWKD